MAGNPYVTKHACSCGTAQHSTAQHSTAQRSAETCTWSSSRRPSTASVMHGMRLVGCWGCSPMRPAGGRHVGGRAARRAVISALCPVVSTASKAASQAAPHQPQTSPAPSPKPAQHPAPSQLSTHPTLDPPTRGVGAHWVEVAQQQAAPAGVCGRHVTHHLLHHHLQSASSAAAVPGQQAGQSSDAVTSPYHLQL